MADDDSARILRDQQQQIQELRAKVARTRLDFLETGLVTCFLTMDIAKVQLEGGRADAALSELEVAARCAETIRIFLARIPPEQGAAISARLEELERTVASFRVELAKSW